MWNTQQLSNQTTQDEIERFLALINTQAQDFFVPESPLFVARAPGRLDLMGGIADYSGSLVLELPLAVATIAAAQRVPEAAITVMSTRSNEIGGNSVVSVDLAALQGIDYATARELLNTNPGQHWAAYVIGVLIALQKERGLKLEDGLRILVDCAVPIGKGVSSSAALEVATMQALSALLGIELEGLEIAILCQKVENLVVGAPCGIMDQMTSACGEQDSLLALLCQPAELLPAVRLPENVEIWGIDSGIRHAVIGVDYSSVRVGAFMGYRIIAEMQGFPVKPQGSAIVEIDDPLWHGYLANISPSLWESRFRDAVPVSMQGGEFLKRYGGSTDTVTEIHDWQIYTVRQPTAHPIYEHHRVSLFRTLLSRPNLQEEDLELLGELMYQSHASYSACGLGSHGTNRLVDLVRQVGPQGGVYGAKITGGGSGGTVAVLTRRGARSQIEAIAAHYKQETKIEPIILNGSSPGAKAWGVVQFHYER